MGYKLIVLGSSTVLAGMHLTQPVELPSQNYTDCFIENGVGDAPLKRKCTEDEESKDAMFRKTLACWLDPSCSVSDKNSTSPW